MFPLALLAVIVAAVSPDPTREHEGPTVRSEPQRGAGVPFEETARLAGEAWEAGRSAEALGHVRAGLELNPLWREGLWLLGLIHTSEGRFDEARRPLLRLVGLEPDAGPPWALLGLCEYRLRDYEQALAHLWKGTSLGGFDDEALRRESLLHFALLLMRNGDFGSAGPHLTRAVGGNTSDPAFHVPCGLFALRLPRLPEEVRGEERDLVATAGRAGCAALARRTEDARRGFEDLLARYPRERGVHFVYGLFLRHEALPGALAMLEEEVRLFPDHAEAHTEMALEILERGTPADALASARRAAHLAPGQPAAHLAYGRALVATGDVGGGITELEKASALASEDRDVCLALAQAYAASGRTEDVARVRARLLELDARQGVRSE